MLAYCAGCIRLSDFYHEGHKDLEGFFSIFVFFVTLVVKAKIVNALC